MANPTTRVLAVLELLQAHGQLGGAELAERLGVDRRTIRRYMTLLEDMGVPIMTEQGRYGGYRLVAGFKLPPHDVYRRRDPRYIPGVASRPPTRPYGGSTRHCQCSGET